LSLSYGIIAVARFSQKQARQQLERLARRARQVEIRAARNDPRQLANEFDFYKGNDQNSADVSSWMNQQAGAKRHKAARLHWWNICLRRPV